METIGKDFSAASVRNFLRAKKQEAENEQRAYEAAAKAQREKLHEQFMEREVKPEALQNVAALVQKAIDRGEKQALLFQFPSDWLPDSGRAITSQDPLWHEKLDGFAKKAYIYFARELAPRGFQLRAQIVDWPGGMPGDVGFFLTWKSPEDV
jgi:hydroxylamine reductase (hybrid-cluster protein)